MEQEDDSFDAEPLLEQLEKIKEAPNKGANDFIIHGSIGKGSFGTIFCVSPVNNPETKYAMKSYMKSKMLSNNLIRFLFIEKKIMTNFDHPFIVKLHYSF